MGRESTRTPLDMLGTSFWGVKHFGGAKRSIIEFWKQKLDPGIKAYINNELRHLSCSEQNIERHTFLKALQGSFLWVDIPANRASPWRSDRETPFNSSILKKNDYFQNSSYSFIKNSLFINYSTHTHHISQQRTKY